MAADNQITQRRRMRRIMEWTTFMIAWELHCELEVYDAIITGVRMQVFCRCSLSSRSMNCWKYGSHADDSNIMQ